MHRIDNSTAIAVLPTPAAPGVPGYFTSGNPISGTPATIVDEEWLNAQQESPIALMAAAGVLPVKGDYTGEKRAVLRLAGGNVTNINASAALTPDQAGLVVVTAAAALTLALPAANAAGGIPLRLSIYRADMTANAVPLALAAGNTINGLTAADLPPGATIGLVSDGVTAWWLVGSAGLYRMQSLSVTATVTVPWWARSCRARVWGGGGGGGGVTSGSFNSISQAGGGGGYAERVFAVAPNASIACTVGTGGAAGSNSPLMSGGTGGTSSVGSYVSATGGGGGQAVSGGIGTSGGLPGNGTGGDINISGVGGQSGHIVGSALFTAVGGGAFGSGYGARSASTAAQSGNAAVAPGMGGNGGIGGDAYGGAGQPGRIILEWMP